MTVRELRRRPQVDDYGVAAVDQLGGSGCGQAAATPAADGRPQEQPTGDEDDRDEYKVCVIGEKLHGKSAEKERNRKNQKGAIRPL
jgi:hypothetical protein